MSELIPSFVRTRCGHSKSRGWGYREEQSRLTSGLGEIGEVDMWDIDTYRFEETRALGFHISQRLAQPLVIALVGDLGSGKTCFTQGLGAGLEVEADVTSPTFVLIQEYEGRLPLLHADLYRLRTGELEAIGIEEQIETWTGLVVVEWADRFPDLLPSEHLRIEIFDLGEDRRRVRLIPKGFEISAIVESILDDWKGA